MRILYITSSFEKKGSASVRNIALANGLIANNCDVDVLTQAWPDSMIDKSLSLFIEPKIKIYKDHIKIIDIVFLHKSSNGNKNENKSFIKSAVSRLINKIKRIAKIYYFFPDIDKEWLYCYKKDLPYELYDLIISSSDTKTSHFVAEKISKKYKIPWFTYWGDPWGDDWGTQGIKKLLACHYEKKLIFESDYSFYVSEPTMESIKSKYPECKNIAFVRRPYINEITGATFKEDDSIVLSYCGSICYGRNADIFLRSLIDYNTTTDSEKIVLDFYGIYPPEMAERYECQYIHFHGHVDFGKVNDVTRQSDALLVFANISTSCQIPGKLFDYFGTDKCIIFVCEEENSVLNFVRSTNRCHILKNENIDINDIKMWVREDKHYPLKEYSAEKVASNLLLYYKEIKK